MKVLAVSDEQLSLEDDPRLDGAALDAPRPAPAWQAWLETVVLAALATASSVIADLGPPWLALAPLLAGLRYGAGLGLACAAAQAAALMVAARCGVLAAEPAAAATLGWLIAGMVPGQFRDAWTRRLHRLEIRAGDAQRQLGTLARAYHRVVASHDRLQREVPGSPSSLRDALEAFAREVEAADIDPDAGVIRSLGERILALFRAHGSVRAATLHAVDDSGRAGAAVAALGSEVACRDDALLDHAIGLCEVVSVRDLPAHTGVLVAVPLADVTGRVHAVVAVHELPFLALHEDTLTLFAVLGGHLGDVIARALEPAATVVKGQPTRAFCASVSRALREARRHGIPAALAVVELEASPGESHVPRLLARCLAAHRRVTDEAEIVVDGTRTVRVVTLLKLASAAGLRSYCARLEQLARARAVELGSRCEIRLRGWSLSESPLPRQPRALGAGLAALLKTADPSSSTPVPRRRHGHVA